MLAAPGRPVAAGVRDLKTWKRRTGPTFRQPSGQPGRKWTTSTATALDDLEGQANRRLVAFRGESPELWHRSVVYRCSRVFSVGGTTPIKPGADFDGDGITEHVGMAGRAPVRSSSMPSPSHAMGPYLDLGFRSSE